MLAGREGRRGKEEREVEERTGIEGEKIKKDEDGDGERRKRRERRGEKTD